MCMGARGAVVDDSQMWGVEGRAFDVDTEQTNGGYGYGGGSTTATGRTGDGEQKKKV